MTISIDHDTHRAARGGSLEYRLLLAVCFAAFLVVALTGRAMPWRWRMFGGEGSLHRTVFDEALARANATAPYAFMC